MDAQELFQLRTVLFAQRLGAVEPLVNKYLRVPHEPAQRCLRAGKGNSFTKGRDRWVFFVHNPFYNPGSQCQ